MRTIAACSLFSLFACTDEIGTADIESELTLGNTPTIATSQASGPQPWSPPTSTHTCFLRGISGNLPSKSIGAHVYPSNGFWRVSVDGSPSNVVKVHVACVAVPYANIELAWANNLDQSALSVNAIANRHCFLRSVTNASGLDGTVAFGKGATNITIKKTAGKFTMAGSYVHTLGSAIATCIDLPATTELWTGTTTGPAPGLFGAGTETTTIRNSHSDAVCGLTAVAGKWSNPSPSAFGADDGVYAYISEVANFWEVTATNGKQATVHCLK